MARGPAEWKLPPLKQLSPTGRIIDYEGFSPFRYMRFDELTTPYPQELVWFGKAMEGTTCPISPGHWRRLSEPRRLNLLKYCEKLAKDGKGKHAQWEELWARYLAQKLIS